MVVERVKLGDKVWTPLQPRLASFEAHQRVWSRQDIQS